MPVLSQSTPCLHVVLSVITRLWTPIILAPFPNDHQPVCLRNQHINISDALTLTLPSIYVVRCPTLWCTCLQVNLDQLNEALPVSEIASQEETIASDEAMMLIVNV
jgi:hypothetical protein